MTIRGLAVHAFAGGIVMGVRAAGVRVRQAYEPLGFGTETLRQRLGLEVYTPELAGPVEEWPLPDLRGGQPDFVFGNPRCGGFSNLGSNTAVAGQSKGYSCRQSIDARQLCEFGARLRAPIVAFESVQSVDRQFLREVMRDVFGRKYRFAHLYHNAATFGSCQYRRRYYFVAYRRDLTFNAVLPRRMPMKQPTVGEVLKPLMKRKVSYAELNKKGQRYDRDTCCELQWQNKIVVEHLEEGHGLNELLHLHGPKFFKRLGCDPYYQRAKNAKSIIPFAIIGIHMTKLKWDGPCPVLVGTCCELIHPRLPRPLTIGELSALMGWPDGVVPAGDYPGPQIAKGIVPHTGTWLADCVRACLEDRWRGVDEELLWNTKTQELEVREVDGVREKKIDLTGMVPKKTVTIFNSVRRSERELT